MLYINIVCIAVYSSVGFDGCGVTGRTSPSF